MRLLQGDDRRLWLLAGLVAGVTMLANSLVAFLLAGFDNDENGTTMSYCVPASPWSQLWPRFRHVG